MNVNNQNTWQNVYSQTSISAADILKPNEWNRVNVDPTPTPQGGPVYQTINAAVIPDATTSIPSFYQPTITSSSYQTVYANNEAFEQKYEGNDVPYVTTTSSPQINNLYSGSGSIIVKASKQNDDQEQNMGNLGGVISESKTEVVFPDDLQPLDSYSYYGALKPKGSNFVPLNSSNHSADKAMDRMLYTPPPLPPDFDFSYYGALRGKGANFVPINSSKHSAANPEKILNDEVYQKSLQPNNQDPDVPNQMDFTTPAVSLNNQYKYNNTPIDVYSQYGALRSKNG